MAGTVLVDGGTIVVSGGTATVASTTQINLSELAGNDDLSVDETNGFFIKAVISGGDGNDNLAGGSGGDELDGGRATTRFLVASGPKFSWAATWPLEASATIPSSGTRTTVATSGRPSRRGYAPVPRG